MRAGSFIVLEGIDGAGKSEQCARLANALRDHGRTVFECADSRFGPWGEAARAWMHGTPTRDAGGRIRDTDDPSITLEYFCRDRQELSVRIQRELAQGHDVVCDRWEPSTWAYHLAAGVPSSEIVKTIFAFPPRVYPDLTFWLVLPPHMAFYRVRRAALAGLRPSIAQRYETVEFLARVAENYASIPGLVKVDAELEPERVLACLEAHYALHVLNTFPMARWPQ